MTLKLELDYLNIFKIYLPRACKVPATQGLFPSGNKPCVAGTLQ